MRGRKGRRAESTWDVLAIRIPEGWQPVTLAIVQGGSDERKVVPRAAVRVPHSILELQLPQLVGGRTPAFVVRRESRLRCRVSFAGLRDRCKPCVPHCRLAGCQTVNSWQIEKVATTSRTLRLRNRHGGSANLRNEFLSQIDPVCRTGLTYLPPLIRDALSRPALQ